MDHNDFIRLSPTWPKAPGVYQFFDKEGDIIYIGKAKDLRNRLNSYFGEKRHIPYKARTMVKKADDLTYTVVPSEHDALLLESTLVKKFLPKYNVMLKDGKSFSYICVKKERFPRVFFTRRVYKDGSTYFGPYTSKYRAKIVLDLVQRIFQLRTCSHNLSKKNVEAGKFKICLEFHIKNCQGPCEGRQTEEAYNEKIDFVKHILRGNLKRVKDYIKSEMELHAGRMNFELAQDLKEKLELFEDYRSKSTVVNTSIKDVDVFYIISEKDLSYINYLKIVNGSLINTDTIEAKSKMEEDDRTLLEISIPHIRDKFDSIAEEIIVPFKVDTFQDIKITIPQRGDKKKLLELSERNLKQYIHQKKMQEISRKRKISAAERVLTTVKNDLYMDDLPLHIECFDNSNIQGSNPVASCVVFKNGKPAKKEYRHFNIKTVEGPNDFASMEEVVYRRYSRLVKEDKSLPQLVIIDGGKGQLSSAVKSLKRLDLLDKITIIGIAKRLEEIFFPDDPIPIYINKKSESLKLIQHARNEAHRFAINFHRTKRSQKFLATALTDIPGVGKSSADKLLKEFKSITRIKTMGIEDLKKIVNKSIALKVYRYFQEEED